MCGMGVCYALVHVCGVGVRGMCGVCVVGAPV